MRAQHEASDYSVYLWFLIEVISIAALLALLALPGGIGSPVGAKASPTSYTSELQPKVARVQQALQHLAASQALDLRDGQLFDTAWRATELGYTNELEAAANAIIVMAPPTAERVVHRNLAGGMRYCVTSAQHLRLVLTAFKPALLHEMTEQLRLCRMGAALAQAWLQQPGTSLGTLPVAPLPQPTPVVAIVPALAGAQKPTPGLILVPTATAPLARPVANDVANLRAGPGTNYAILGRATVSQSLPLMARNPAGDWYQLNDGTWIAAFLVSHPPPALPIATVTP